MKKYLPIFVCVLCIALMGAKAAIKEKEPELVVSEQECQALTSYDQPKGVEFEPDVDVHGKPVVEADVTPPVVTIPEKFSFDVTVDGARYIGLPVPVGSEMSGKVGTMTIEKGKASFNGTPLEGEAEATLKQICADQAEKAADKAPKGIDRK